MSAPQIIKLTSSDSAEISVGESQPKAAWRSARRHAVTEVMLMNLPIEREVAERSVLIKNMMEDIGEQAVEEAIPIPNVCSMPVHIYYPSLTKT